MDNFIVIVFIYIKGRKESVIVMIKPTHSKVWKTAESNYVLNKLNKLFIYLLLSNATSTLQWSRCGGGH